MTTATASKPKKNAPKKPKKLSQDAKRGLIDTKLDELVDARRQHSEAVLSWEEAHAHAGELKKTMERKQALVNQVCADLEAIRKGNYTPPLPFGEDAATAKTETPTGSGRWRSVPMADVVNGQLIKALENAGVTTVGEFRDRVELGQNIPGIGPGKQGKIADALMEFWKTHPELLEEPEVKAAESPAAEPAPVEVPPCPTCESNAKAVDIGDGQYRCDKCTVIYDRNPDEGGTHFNDPAKRIEKEEQRASTKRRRK